MIAEIKRIDHRVGILLATLCGIIVGIVAYSLVHPMQLIGYDFQAFWCGGKALLQHANPYANEPLHTCESTTSPAFFARYPQVTIPVPLPGYAIALFTPFALLPFVFARAIWWMLLVVSAFSIGRAISKISGMPPITATAASALAVLGPSILQGALSPIPIALTVFAALALQREQWNRAAVLLGFAMIEPHMVLPACAAVFLLVPQMRARLVAAGACAAAVTLIVVGPEVALSYFTTILPVHAAAEINNLGQDSLTALLYHLGVPGSLALRLGLLQYGLLAIAGFFAAWRLYKKTADRSWLILLPAAFAVIGGEFIHLDEVAMVVPLACVIAMRRPSALAIVVLALLAIPAESVVNWIPLSIPAALVCCWFMDRWAGKQRLVSSGFLPLVATLAIIGGAFAMHTVVVANAERSLSQAVRIANPGPMASASLSWSTYNKLSKLPATWWPEKLLTEVPLVILLGLCAWEALRKDVAPTPTESIALRWSRAER